MNQSSVCVDDTFGPVIHGCRENFDFTLLFEQSFFSILPSLLFILLSSRRIYSLRAQPRRVSGTSTQNSKLLLIILYGLLQIALLILYCLPNTKDTRTAIPSTVLYNIVVVFLCILSYQEHTKSIRPSSILNVYLLCTLIFDAVQLRTIWLRNTGSTNTTIAGVFTASLATKLCMVLLEAQEKHKLLYHQDRSCSPEEKSSIYNKAVFWWLKDLLVRGRKKILTLEDLYPLNAELSTEHLLPKFQNAWEKAGAGAGNHRALYATFRALVGPILISTVPRFCLIGFNFCQPLLINRFTTYLQEPITEKSRNQGYGLVGAYGLVYLGITVRNFTNPKSFELNAYSGTAVYYRLTYRSLIMIRGVLVSAIYLKTTQIGAGELENSAAVTLMSADTERIMFALRQMHEVWGNLIEVGLATWLLYTQVGFASFAPLVIAAGTLTSMKTPACLTGQYSLWFCLNMAQFESKYPTTRMDGCNTRASGSTHIESATTAATFSAIKGVKMLGLTEKLFKTIHTLRLTELLSAKAFRQIEVITAFFGEYDDSILILVAINNAYVPETISPVVTFAIFVNIPSHDSEKFASSVVYTSISTLLLETQPLTSLFQVIPQISAAVGCFSRISLFLESQSLVDKRAKLDSNIARRSEEFIPGVDSFSLNDMNLPKDSRASAAMNLATVPLAPQSSIKIQGGKFGWTKDFLTLHNIDLQFPASQLTMVIGPVASGKSTLCSAILGEIPFSEGTVQLSSSRIALCDQTPFLTNKTLRENIVGSSKFDSRWYNTVIDAVSLSRDLKTLPCEDRTLVGANGVGLSGGQKQRVSIARAVYARNDIALFDDVFNGLDATTKQRVFTRVFGGQGLLRRNESTVVLFTNDVDLIRFADHVVALGTAGTVIEQGSPESLLGTQGYTQRLVASNLKVVESVLEENMEAPNPSRDIIEPSEQAPSIPGTTPGEGNNYTDLSVYWYYFTSIGIFNMILYVLLAASFGFFYNFPLVWLSWWSAANNNDTMYLSVYSVFQVLGLVSITLLAQHGLNTMAKKSGKILHLRLLTTAILAPLSFFHTTDAGSITNRFSQDILLIDTELPNALMNIAAFTFMMIGQAIIIAVASPYVAIAYPALIGVLYIIQKFYLETSRQLRLLELDTKSPLYTHFLETSRGIRTIRAFNWTSANQELNSKLLDTSQRPVYLLFMVQQWLAVILNLVTTAIVMILVGIATVTRSQHSYIGLALVNLMSFNNILKSIVILWTTLETSIGSVARIKRFSETTESESETNHLPRDVVDSSEVWPQHGTVELKDVGATYKSVTIPYGTSQAGLESHITLNQTWGEDWNMWKEWQSHKCNSGKSSLILTLFRMLDLSRGCITIDGIDITRLPRELVRSRLNAIPQEPFFVKGTFRDNLDPHEVADDVSLMNALRMVSLGSIVPSTGSLDSEMDADILSHGQRQLFCLARAIVRPAKILIMDEATSNMDQETDALIQGIIRNVFKNCTIIAVAHRLNTIVDFDRVALFDQGELMEFDAPANLLERPSLFKRLYEDQQLNY
ncbi:ABC multidrug transporter protein [Rutstroemia sp. NJR-2017a WRK4]|nr:ABC multidrug transporter protein [Rutstroemia sp. NJR-2017a WRK4]